MTVLLATITLLAAAACKHQDSDYTAQPPPQVWAVDLHEPYSRNTGLQATWAGDRHQATLAFTVYATMCDPQALEETIARGYGYGPPGRR